MKLRFNYTWDAESQNWCFVVPGLGIIGGGETREQAQEQAVQAIEFTLESENEAPTSPFSEVAYVRVPSRPADAGGSVETRFSRAALPRRPPRDVRP